jgi:sugar phosphate isomerase/epimerase
MWTVIASSLAAPHHAELFERAPRIGARTMRLALTAVLAGDRAAFGDAWHDLVAQTRSSLVSLAARARAAGLDLAIENHQDFTSGELMELCEGAGDNVGVCMDTGNPMAVGESCQDFLATVSPRLRHVHLKDYRAQPTLEGYRLIRCPAGDGIVPFADLRASFEGLDATAALECGAHEARHIRFMVPGFWDRYPPHSAARLSACLRTLTARSIPADADYRTPWERGADGAALLEYERHEIQASIANLIELGYWTP